MKTLPLRMRLRLRLEPNRFWKQESVIRFVSSLSRAWATPKSEGGLAAVSLSKNFVESVGPSGCEEAFMRLHDVDVLGK